MGGRRVKPQLQLDAFKVSTKEVTLCLTVFVIKSLSLPGLSSLFRRCPLLVTLSLSKGSPTFSLELPRSELTGSLQQPLPLVNDTREVHLTQVLLTGPHHQIIISVNPPEQQISTHTKTPLLFTDKVIVDILVSIKNHQPCSLSKQQLINIWVMGFAWHYGKLEPHVI